jgi:hypothetical protein
LSPQKAQLKKPHKSKTCGVSQSNCLLEGQNIPHHKPPKFAPLLRPRLAVAARARSSAQLNAWGALALLKKKMMAGMGVFQTIQSWQLPMPGSNRGYAPTQLLEQMMVSI